MNIFDLDQYLRTQNKELTITEEKVPRLLTNLDVREIAIKDVPIDYEHIIWTDNFIANTLSRMLGYDYTNNIWRRFAVNSSGAIEVSASGSLGTTFNSGAISVTTSATLIKAVNTARRTITITNNDTTNILFLGGTSGVTSANFGVKLAPQQAFTFSEYEGDVYGIADAGTIDTHFGEEAD